MERYSSSSNVSSAINNTVQNAEQKEQVDLDNIGFYQRKEGFDMNQDGETFTSRKTTNSILIVDDSQETCQLLELLFKRNGYRTVVANHGREALCIVEEKTPDLVILDVLMPDMDGWEIFQRLKGLANIPVLFLSGLTSGDDVSRALRLGAADYIRKPFSTSELLSRVDTLLARSRVDPIPENEIWRGLKLEKSPVVVTVIPAYNEERFIGSVVLKARKYSQKVIVIDDGSSDDTTQVARDAGALVISHPFNRGKGAALNTAFRVMGNHQLDVIVILDGDGQHLPEELARVVEPVLKGEADIVVGSRYINRISRVPRHRIIGHWVFKWITLAASGVFVSDSQSGFRAFSRKALESILLDSNGFSSNGFSVESEMQFIARENHLRLVEVPITIRYEDPPKRSVMAHGLFVLNGILNLVGQYRPLLFFGLPGFFLIGLGFSWGLWVVDIYSKTRQLATGYALISVMLSIIGLVMVHTGFILHSIRGILINMMRSFSSR